MLSNADSKDSPRLGVLCVGLSRGDGWCKASGVRYSLTEQKNNVEIPVTLNYGVKLELLLSSSQ